MQAILTETRPAYKNSFDTSKGYKFMQAGTKVSIIGHDENTDRFIGITDNGWTVNFNTEQATPIE